jgi:hypothetical protein
VQPKQTAHSPTITRPLRLLVFDSNRQSAARYRIGVANPIVRRQALGMKVMLLTLAAAGSRSGVRDRGARRPERGRRSGDWMLGVM